MVKQPIKHKEYVCIILDTELGDKVSIKYKQVRSVVPSHRQHVYLTDTESGETYHDRYIGCRLFKFYHRLQSYDWNMYLEATS